VIDRQRGEVWRLELAGSGRRPSFRYIARQLVETGQPGAGQGIGPRRLGEVRS
jgi:hypothetical protein